jgi:hypothetical protein
LPSGVCLSFQRKDLGIGKVNQEMLGTFRHV